MKDNKICINKKIVFIIPLVLVLLAVILFSSFMNKQNYSTKSRASGLVPAFSCVMGAYTFTTNPVTVSGSVYALDVNGCIKQNGKYNGQRCVQPGNFTGDPEICTVGGTSSGGVPAQQTAPAAQSTASTVPAVAASVAPIAPSATIFCTKDGITLYPNTETTYLGRKYTLDWQGCILKDKVYIDQFCDFNTKKIVTDHFKCSMPCNLSGDARLCATNLCGQVNSESGTVEEKIAKCNAAYLIDEKKSVTQVCGWHLCANNKAQSSCVPDGTTDEVACPTAQSAPPATAPSKQININFSIETMQNYADMYYKVHKANSQLLQTNQEYACQRAVNFTASYAVPLIHTDGTRDSHHITFSFPAYDQNNPYYNPMDDLPNIVNIFKDEIKRYRVTDCSSGDIVQLTDVEYSVDTNQWIGQGCMGGRDSVIHHTFYQSSISGGQSVSCGDSTTLDIKVQ